MCEICRESSDEANLYFCDKCDDGYHNYCLKVDEEKFSETCWICPNCIAEDK